MKKLKIAGVPLFSRAAIKWFLVFSKASVSRIKSLESISDITDFHFDTWSSRDDRMYQNFSSIQFNIKPRATIIETGTSAWGCDSSRLFDKIADFLDGEFHSVDIRKEASKWLLWQTSKNTHFYVMDSVTFLSEKLKDLQIDSIDLLYLDSFDLDLQNPFPSMTHTLEEFKSAEKYLIPGSYVIIDDSPSSLAYFKQESLIKANQFFKKFQLLPGKGSLVHRYIKSNSNYEIIAHNTQLVFKLN